MITQNSELRIKKIIEDYWSFHCMEIGRKVKEKIERNKHWLNVSYGLVVILGFLKVSFQCYLLKEYFKCLSSSTSIMVAIDTDSCFLWFFISIIPFVEKLRFIKSPYINPSYCALCY